MSQRNGRPVTLDELTDTDIKMIDLRQDIRISLWIINSIIEKYAFGALPLVWTPTLKKGEKINSRVVYGCPEKYLTQEKTDEAH